MTYMTWQSKNSLCYFALQRKLKRTHTTFVQKTSIKFELQSKHHCRHSAMSDVQYTCHLWWIASNLSGKTFELFGVHVISMQYSLLNSRSTCKMGFYDADKQRFPFSPPIMSQLCICVYFALLGTLTVCLQFRHYFHFFFSSDSLFSANTCIIDSFVLYRGQRTKQYGMVCH